MTCVNSFQTTLSPNPEQFCEYHSVTKQRYNCNICSYDNNNNMCNNAIQRYNNKNNNHTIQQTYVLFSCLQVPLPVVW